jgi:adenylate cyclase
MGPSVPEGRLTRDQLAFEADIPAKLLDDMVAAGILTPAPDGTFPARYVRRTTHIEGLLESGLTLDFVKEIIDRGLGDFDAGDQFMPHPSPRSRATLRQFLESLGSRAELFHQVYAILGFSEPRPDRHLTIEDETMMRRFVDAFSDDPVVAVRSARLMAEGLRPAVDGMAKMQTERLARLYIDAQGTPARQAPPEEVEALRTVIRVAFEMATWLMKRYLDRANAASNVDMFERSLAARGLGPPPGAAHRAIVFADLTGYTALTNEVGDEEAALTALRLRDEVEPLVRPKGGRLVQLLGDGAMLFFDRPASAIESAIELVQRWPTGMPPLHVGVGIGPLYERDGGYFGSTVNLAARLSSAARSGQILAASVAPDAALRRPGLQPVAPLTLKGFPQPIRAFDVPVSLSDTRAALSKVTPP